MDLRKAAKNKPCVLCGRDDGTTVLHHVQLPGNHGIGRKPEDFPWGVRVCSRCHAHFHGEGRGDYQAMAMAMGRQMIVYRAEGVVSVSE